MKPLDERHHRAAAMLAHGDEQADVAGRVGVSRRTVSDWMKREDFAALVAEVRERDADSEPGALAVFRELLGRTKPDGTERDDAIRLRAAVELVRIGRGGRDPEDDGEESAGVTVLDPSLLEDDPEPKPLDLAAERAAWGGEVSERERNLDARTPPWGEG